MDFGATLSIYCNLRFSIEYLKPRCQEDLTCLAVQYQPIPIQRHSDQSIWRGCHGSSNRIITNSIFLELELCDRYKLILQINVCNTRNSKNPEAKACSPKCHILSFLFLITSIDCWSEALETSPNNARTNKWQKHCTALAVRPLVGQTDTSPSVTTNLRLSGRHW